MPQITKLSRRQQAVLAALYGEYQQTADDASRATWGVSWRTRMPRSAQASVSRTLKRLEARGLVERRNQCSDARRTTHVKLLPQGLALAQELVNKNTDRKMLTVGELRHVYR